MTSLSNYAGTYNITVGGTSSQNYDITFSNTGKLTVEKADLTITANYSRAIGDANPDPIELTYEGLKFSSDKNNIDVNQSDCRLR